MLRNQKNICKFIQKKVKVLWSYERKLRLKIIALMLTPILFNNYYINPNFFSTKLQKLF